MTLPELPETVPECLARSAESETGRGITVVSEDGTRDFRSYRQIRESADRAAAAFRLEGLEHLDRLIVALPTGFDFLSAFFGALAAGIVPVPFPAPEEDAERAAFRRAVERTGGELDAAGLLHAGNLSGWQRPGGSGAGPFSLVSEVGALLEDVPSSITIREPSTLPEIAYIQMTEGTTARPRPVELSHRNIVSNVAAIGEALEVTDEDVGVSWIPLHNPLGMIGGVCFGLAFGIDMVLIDPQRFLSNPESWLEAISRYEGTLSPAPNFAYHYAVRRCRESDLEGLDLSSWRVAMTGGEPVRGQHLDAFVQRFGDYGLDDDVFTPVYGLSEATIGVTFGALEESFSMDPINRRILEEEGRARPLPEEGAPTPSERMHLVSVGEALEGVEVRIVDEQGESLESRILGEIAVRGPNLMRGYVGEVDAAGAASLDRGWLRTGDLGYLADGRLYVVGRACDRIRLDVERTIYPEEVEFFVDAVDGVHAGRSAVFGIPERAEERAEERRREPPQRLVVAFELQSGTAIDDVRQPLRRLLETHLALEPDEVVALSPRSIPRTKSGKVQRSLARKLYLEERLDRRERSGRLSQLYEFARRARYEIESVRSRVESTIREFVDRWR